jgi:hypothetical protein
MPRLITTTPLHQDVTPHAIEGALGLASGYIQRKRDIHLQRQADKQLDIQNRLAEAKLAFQQEDLAIQRDEVQLRRGELAARTRQIDLETDRRKMLLEDAEQKRVDNKLAAALDAKRLRSREGQEGSIPRSYSQLGLMPGIDYPDPVSAQDEADIAAITDPALRQRAVEQSLRDQEEAAHEAETAAVAEMIQRSVAPEAQPGATGEPEEPDPSQFYTPKEAEKLLKMLDDGETSPFQVFLMHQRAVQEETTRIATAANLQGRREQVGRMFAGTGPDDGMGAILDDGERAELYQLAASLGMPGVDNDAVFDEIQMRMDPKSFAERQKNLKARSDAAELQRLKEKEAEAQRVREAHPMFERKIDPVSGRYHDTGSRARKTLEKSARSFKSNPLSDDALADIAKGIVRGQMTWEEAEMRALSSGTKIDKDFRKALQKAIGRARSGDQMPTPAWGGYGQDPQAILNRGGGG